MNQEEINLDIARQSVDKLKVDIQKMKADAQPQDQLPVSIMFVLLDQMIPLMDALLKKLEEKESE